MTAASLLLLADARFPDGTHAHSFGLEAAVAAGRVGDPTTLHSYVEARLWSSGRTDCAASRLAARGREPLTVIDDELTVRMPSEATRTVSRALGRSLLRTADRLWPDDPIPRVKGRPPLQPVVFGAVASRAGCTPDEASLAMAHGLAAAIATAALRLLGLDPFSVTSVLASLRDAITTVAHADTTIDSAQDLPLHSTPFAEIDPGLQLRQELRLFGS